MNPTQDQPIVFEGAKGINDATSFLKLKRGYTPFSVNLLAQGDVWDRRKGRDMFLLRSGLALGIATVRFDDGVAFNIAQIGSSLNDLSTFDYFVSSGIRLIMQSSALNYWDVTPNATTGLITPIIVSTPSAAPQTSDFIVAYDNTFAFYSSDGNPTRLTADEEHYGWYLIGETKPVSSTTISTDMVFTYSSGFFFKIEDQDGNTWKLSITSNGNLQAITV
jgi:hypothetical protein